MQNNNLSRAFFWTLEDKLCIRLIPSRTPCLSEVPAYFNARIFTPCVWWWWCCVWLLWRCMSNRWHITVRVAGCTPLQGEVHSLIFSKMNRNVMSILVEEVVHELSREGQKPSKTGPENDQKQIRRFWTMRRVLLVVNVAVTSASELRRLAAESMKHNVVARKWLLTFIGKCQGEMGGGEEEQTTQAGEKLTQSSVHV